MVVDEAYHDKFGLTEDETRQYLEYFGYELNDEVKNYYDGYKFGKEDMYNPMSITTYISKKGVLDSYWVSTSANTLIKEAIIDADEEFKEDFNTLIEQNSCNTVVELNTSFVEKVSETTLWGLLLNAGYVTFVRRLDKKLYELKIPNEEVKSEFQRVVANYTGIGESVLVKE